MKTVLLQIVLLISFSNVSLGQCFMPPDGYTLYTTTDAVYNPPAVTGFITNAPNLSGDWSIVGGTASGSFIDNMGRTSSLTISGTGTLIVENTVTDINPPNDMTTCQHTFNLEEYNPVIVTNPILNVPCPIDIVLVLDESESIELNGSEVVVRDAALLLAERIKDSGSQMAIVEFDSDAENVMINGSADLQLVDDSFITGLDTYLENDYDPTGNPVTLVGGTNWEDALDKANAVPGSGTLILMLTDGRPTFYKTSMGMNGVAGEGFEFDLTALKEAQDAANLIKSRGKHIFVAGLDFPSDKQPIIDISGPIEYPHGGNINEFLSSDYCLVPPGELVDLFANIGNLCAPEIVPTMGEWSIINCGLILMIFAVVGIKNKVVFQVSEEKYQRL